MLPVSAFAVQAALQTDIFTISARFHTYSTVFM